MDLSSLIKLILILIISLSCTIQDIKYHKVSNWIILLGCIIMIAYCFIFNIKGILSSILSSLLLFLIFLISKMILKEKLGWADVYFASFIGLCIPYPLSPVAILISTVIAFFYIIINAKKNRSKTRIESNTRAQKAFLSSIPFIPFLSLGLLISFVLELFCF